MSWNVELKSQDCEWTDAVPRVDAAGTSTPNSAKGEQEVKQKEKHLIGKGQSLPRCGFRFRAWKPACHLFTISGEKKRSSVAARAHICRGQLSACDAETDGVEQHSSWSTNFDLHVCCLTQKDKSVRVFVRAELPERNQRTVPVHSVSLLKCRLGLLLLRGHWHTV